MLKNSLINDFIELMFKKNEPLVQEKRKYKKGDWVVIHIFDVPNHYNPDGIYKITGSYTSFPDIVYYGSDDNEKLFTGFAQKYIVRKATKEEIELIESKF